jgi:hypothetical protein
MWSRLDARRNGGLAMEDELTEDEYQSLERLLLNARGHFSATFFAAGLVTLGVVWWKIVAIYLLVYFLHAFQFGTRRLEQASLLMLAIGIVSWLDVLPVQALVANAKTQMLSAQLVR